MRLIYSRRPLTAAELRREFSAIEVVVFNARCHPDEGFHAAVENVLDSGRALVLQCAVCLAPVVSLAVPERAELPPCPCGGLTSLAAYVQVPPSAAVTCTSCRTHRLLPVLEGGGVARPDEAPAVVREASAAERN